MCVCHGSPFLLAALITHSRIGPVLVIVAIASGGAVMVIVVVIIVVIIVVDAAAPPRRDKLAAEPCRMGPLKVS